jgi:hypothetical protein
MDMEGYKGKVADEKKNERRNEVKGKQVKGKRR